MPLKYFSAFAGIGGFDEGIKRVFPNAKCIGYSEKDKYAIKIYEKHFPDVTNYGDITRIEPTTLPDFDIFCGGFPCQDLSIAGKRAGLCGTRSGLFFDIIRIIRKKQPRIVFLENVVGLFSSNKGWDFATVLIELEKAGYNHIEWQCLNSKNFGVPQNRERVFIIGHLRGTSGGQIFPIGKGFGEINEGAKQTTVNTLTAGGHSGGHHSSMTLILSDSGAGRKTQLRSEIIAPLRGNTGAGSNNKIVQLNQPTHSNDRIYSADGIAPTLNCMEGGNRQPFVKIHSTQPRSGDPKKGGHGPLSRDDGVTYCLDTGNSIAIESNTNIRRLTPIECERLQGYPDNWTAGVSDTQRYKCLGNAVTVNVIEAIVKQMKDKGIGII